MPADAVAAAGRGQLFIQVKRGTGRVETYSGLQYTLSIERSEFENLLEGADLAESERHDVGESKRVKLSVVVHGPAWPGWETEEGRADCGAASLERRGEGVNAAARVHDEFCDRNQMDHCSESPNRAAAASPPPIVGDLTGIPDSPSKESKSTSGILHVCICMSF